MEIPATLTTRGVAKRLGVSLRAIQLWVESGELEAWKTPGGHRRVLLESVNRFVAARMPGAEQRQAEVPLRVVVVEDDADLMRLYQLTIAEWPFLVDLQTARDGFAGLVCIGRHRPHLLITDLAMPELNGFRLLHSLATNPDLRDMRIAVVSGLDPREIADQGPLDSHRVVVLPKPVPFDALQRIAIECREHLLREGAGMPDDANEEEQ